MSQRLKKKRCYLSDKQSAAARAVYDQKLPPLEVGSEFIVLGYHTGTFRGRVESHNGSTLNPRITFEVIDAMRGGPLIESGCAFPECILEDEHSGEHQFAELRNGTRLEIHPGLIRWKRPRLDYAASSERSA